MHLHTCAKPIIFTVAQPTSKPKVPTLKNPKWHRDEIILALDLYFDPNRGSVDARNPNIIALSEVLNQLPIFSLRPDAERFRNPNGVSLKLSNFLAIDPDHEGKGMERGSKLDEIVFHEFKNDRQQLHDLAQQIRAIVANEPLRQQLYQVEEDENIFNDAVPEGQVLYKLHKYRERNAELVADKKKAVLKATGKLACEVCSFDFHQTYGQLGWGFIECHHIKPIATYEASARTKLSDLATVCANCHRMLHRQFGVMTVEKLKQNIKL